MIHVGERVAYSKNFLHSICATSGWMADAKGTVEAIRCCGPTVFVCSVRWDAFPERVYPILHKNLRRMTVR